MEHWKELNRTFNAIEYDPVKEMNDLVTTERNFKHEQKLKEMKL